MAILNPTRQKIPGWRRRALFLQARQTRGRQRGTIDRAIADKASDLLAEIAAEQTGLAKRASSAAAVNSSLVADAQTVLRTIAASVVSLI